MFVERIKALCKEKGITFAQFERESGVGANSVYRWDTNSPSIKKVKMAANYFGLTVSELIGETKTPAHPGERYADSIIKFLESLPKDRLRGILLALGAPEEVITDLDQQE